MYSRVTFILVISLSHVWSHPYRKHQLHEQQQSVSYEHSQYDPYDHSYQRRHVEYFQNQDSPIHSSNLQYSDHQYESNQYHQSPQQYYSPLNTNDREISSQDHLNQKEYVQQVDTFYKQTDKYVSNDADELREPNSDHEIQYQGQEVREQETEPEEQQSALEFGNQQTNTKPDQYMTNYAEALDQQYNIEFGSQKQIEKPYENLETEEFGQHSQNHFGEQQPAELYIVQNQESLDEQQYNIRSGYQQEQRLNTFVNSQETVDLPQQSDNDFGSQQHYISDENTQEKETLDHQAINEFVSQTETHVSEQSGKIRESNYDSLLQYQNQQVNKQESEPLDQQSTLELQNQQTYTKPNKYITQDAETSELGIEFGSYQNAETEEFGQQKLQNHFGRQKQQPTELYTDQNQESLVEQQSHIGSGYQQEEQRLSKFSDSQVTVDLPQQSDVDYGIQQRHTSDVNTQETETFNHQATDQQVNEQKTEPFDRQSTLELQNQLTYTKPNKYITQDAETSEQGIEFGLQKTLKPSYQNAETEEFGQQQLQNHFGEQKPQPTELYTDQNQESLVEQQSHIGSGYQQEEQRLSKFSVSQVTVDLPQQSDVDFGIQQQHTSDMNTQEIETFNQATDQHVNEHETEPFDQQSTLELQNQQTYTKPNKYIKQDAETSEQGIEFGSYQNAETEEFGQQKLQNHFGRQKQQPTELYTDQNQESLVEQQSHIGSGYQQEEQRLSKFSDSQVTVDLPQQSDVDFGIQQQHTSDMNTQEIETFNHQATDQQVNEQETEPFDRQSTLELQNQQTYTKPNKYITQDAETSEQGIEFGSQKTLEQSYQNAETEEFGQQQLQNHFGEQKQQPTELYTDQNQESLVEQQSHIGSGYQQEERRLSKFSDSQVTVDLPQQSDVDYGIQQQHTSDVNTQEIETFNHQATDQQVNEQETEPFDRQSTLELQNQQTYTKPNKYITQDAETSEQGIEFGSQKTLEQSYQNAETEEFGQQQLQNHFGEQKQQPTELYTDQNQESLVEQQSHIGSGYQQEEQRLSKFSDSQVTVDLPQQSDVDYGIQQQHTSDVNTQEIATFNHQATDQQVNEQETEPFDRQSTLELQNQQTYTKPNKYITQDAETSEQGIEFGSQKTLEQSYQNAETEKFGQQQLQNHFGEQKQQPTELYTDQNQESLVDQQSHIESGYQQQEQRLSMLTNSQETVDLAQQSDSDFGSHQHISDTQFQNYQDSQQREHKQEKAEFGQQSVLEFGTQQQGQSTYNHFNDQHSDRELDEQSNIEFGVQQQEQKPNKYTDYSDSRRKIQFYSEVDSNDNSYTKLQQENKFQNGNINNLHIIAPENDLKKGVDSEKDPYECLNFKVNELEKELSSKLEEVISTSSLRPIEELNAVNDNVKNEIDINTYTNVYGQETNKTEQENFSEISTTVNSEAVEDTQSSPKQSFWQKVQNKVSETYTNVQNKASDLVKKVKNKINS